MQRRHIIAAFAALSIAGTLPAAAAAKDLKVGATAGPHAAIVAEAAMVARTRGLKVKVVEFTDYITPNQALEDGALDVVVYQHEPFLNNYNKQRGTHLAKIANAVVQPMGLYSNRIRSLKAIPNGARIAIPNDPTNSGRALLLLQNAGLITLRSGVDGSKAVLADIKSNPRRLKIIELEAALLPRSLDDADVTAIPMNYVISAGLSPKKQGFFFEDLKAPFALMIIASRENNRSDASVRAFVKAYQSEPVRTFIIKTFKGAVNPAW